MPKGTAQLLASIDQPVDILQKIMLKLRFYDLVKVSRSNRRLNLFCQCYLGDEKEFKKSFWEIYFNLNPDQFPPVINLVIRSRSNDKKVPKFFVTFCMFHKNFTKEQRKKVLNEVGFKFFEPSPMELLLS